jgi:hypothetical protein
MEQEKLNGLVEIPGLFSLTTNISNRKGKEQLYPPPPPSRNKKEGRQSIAPIEKSLRNAQRGSRPSKKTEIGNRRKLLANANHSWKINERRKSPAKPLYYQVC